MAYRKTTTYRIGYAERCRSCGSVRSGRGVGEYEKHANGDETLINCSDCHRQIACECGKVYPISESDKLSPTRINDVATCCTACYPSRHQREIAKAATRCRLRLAQHIAKQRKREIYRDVAIRYIQRFHGKTFSVQNGISTPLIFLENRKGHVIGQVRSEYKYPRNKPDFFASEEFADMPF